MLDAITATQVALLQDQMRLESISQNVSNMQTPGYKRQIIENAEFDAHVQAQMANVRDSMYVATEFQQGKFIQSGNPRELAIVGDGYFEVLTDEGIFYTRRGDFHVNEQGELATSTGARLMGKMGVLHVDNHPFTVDRSGTLFIEHQPVEQMSLVQFSNPKSLNYKGQGLYESLEKPLPAHGSTHVLQGHLEQSNVKSIDEMMDMVKISRHFEATQRVMHTADGLLAMAIDSLGEENV